jgi:hypothetical protein
LSRELALLDLLDVGESSGGRVSVGAVRLFCRYWCGPRLGVDRPLEYPGRTACDLDVGELRFRAFPGPVASL